MKKLVTAQLLASLLAVSPSLPASAQTTVSYESSPVQIVRYSFEPAYQHPITEFGATSVDLRGLPEARISFVNVGTAVATRVRFIVRSGNRSERLVDTGTFSPRSNITHSFAVYPEVAGASIQVESVDFVDGTSWQLK
jgi:hypothetical protein